MPSTGAEASSSTIEPAVLKAQSSFRDAAHQQLKKMMARGVESDSASVQLMDRLLSHGAGPGASSAAAASPHIPHVISVTGFTPAQAAKTLLLKEEIATLRRQGHGTPALIEMLQKRLRLNASSRGDENGPSRQPQKKLKRADEGPPDLHWPPLPDAQKGLPSLRGGGGGGGGAKRRPDEHNLVSPPKKPKPRAKGCD